MENVRIIKRYQNRKLYDTHQSCYVTLEEIAQIIRNGNEIQVLDNKSKRDITYTTQIQLLFDQERRAKRVENTELLKRVIRSESGILSGYIKKLEAQLNIADHSKEEKFVDETQFDDLDLNIANRVNPDSTIETPNTLN